RKNEKKIIGIGYRTKFRGNEIPRAPRAPRTLSPLAGSWPWMDGRWGEVLAHVSGHGDCSTGRAAVPEEGMKNGTASSAAETGELGRVETGSPGPKTDRKMGQWDSNGTAMGQQKPRVLSHIMKIVPLSHRL